MRLAFFGIGLAMLAGSISGVAEAKRLRLRAVILFTGIIVIAMSIIDILQSTGVTQ